MKVLGIFKTLKVMFAKFLKSSDYNRWSNPNALKESWDSRTIKIAKLITPNTSVLEFGAGRMVLRKYLHQSCAYTPSDIVVRGPGTIVVDLNLVPYKLLDGCEGEFDIVVFSGVLEYIYDLEVLMSYLYNYVEGVVLSYACAVKGESIANRRKQGWVNDYTYEEITDLFDRSGFEVKKEDTWKKQSIFVLSKSLIKNEQNS